MTKEAQRADPHKTIWRIANDLRGSVDGWDFKQYVLGMLFYRFISENLAAYLNEHERKAGSPDFDYALLDDPEAEFGRAETVSEKGFYILPSELFVNVRRAARNDENLNETLERAFHNIEGSAVGTDSEYDLMARIHEEISAELLSRLVEQDPAFFEGAVVELLLAMGYGGVGGRGVTTDLTHDGGIDGVIDQDVLGLRKVYVQAKRYSPNNSVQRPEVQGFVGALSGMADGGVFITTSRFSPGAVQWVRTVPARIILIDGRRLTELMIEYGVGVQVERTYRVVEIDEDFFT